RPGRRSRVGEANRTDKHTPAGQPEIGAEVLPIGKTRLFQEEDRGLPLLSALERATHPSVRLVVLGVDIVASSAVVLQRQHVAGRVVEILYNSVDRRERVPGTAVVDFKVEITGRRRSAGLRSQRAG